MCVQLLDWKGGQTSLFDWSCMVWVVVMIIKTIGTIIPTKHSYGKDHMCLWKRFEKQKKMHGTSHYTKYGWGGFLLMGSLYPFVGASFCACFIPLGFLHHLARLPRTHTHVHVLCMQFRSTFCLCPLLHLRSPHQIHIWKRKFY